MRHARYITILNLTDRYVTIITLCLKYMLNIPHSWVSIKSTDSIGQRLVYTSSPEYLNYYVFGTCEGLLQSNTFNVNGIDWICYKYIGMQFDNADYKEGLWIEIDPPRPGELHRAVISKLDRYINDNSETATVNRIKERLCGWHVRQYLTKASHEYSYLADKSEYYSDVDES